VPPTSLHKDQYAESAGLYCENTAFLDQKYRNDPIAYRFKGPDSTDDPNKYNVMFDTCDSESW